MQVVDGFTTQVPPLHNRPDAVQSVHAPPECPHSWSVTPAKHAWVVSQHPPGHVHAAPLELPLDDDELGCARQVPPSQPTGVIAPDPVPAFDPLPLLPPPTPLVEPPPLLPVAASELTISMTLPPHPRAAQATTTAVAANVR